MPDLLPGRTAGRAHFLHAERLLEEARELAATIQRPGEFPGPHERRAASLVATAQVHALLAVASANSHDTSMGMGWTDQDGNGLNAFNGA